MMLKAAQSLLFAVDLPISRLQRSQNSWAFTQGALPWAITFRAFGAEPGFHSGSAATAYFEL
jgi:hypothetical protein